MIVSRRLPLASVTIGALTVNMPSWSSPVVRFKATGRGKWMSSMSRDTQLCTRERSAESVAADTTQFTVAEELLRSFPSADSSRTRTASSSLDASSHNELTRRKACDVARKFGAGDRLPGTFCSPGPVPAVPRQHVEFSIRRLLEDV